MINPENERNSAEVGSMDRFNLLVPDIGYKYHNLRRKLVSGAAAAAVALSPLIAACAPSPNDQINPRSTPLAAFAGEGTLRGVSLSDWSCEQLFWSLWQKMAHVMRDIYTVVIPEDYNWDLHGPNVQLPILRKGDSEIDTFDTWNNIVDYMRDYCHDFVVQYNPAEQPGIEVAKKGHETGASQEHIYTIIILGAKIAFSILVPEAAPVLVLPK